MTKSSEPGHDTLADDVLGFGVRELVTTRDVVVRPRTVLEAWMTRGAEGGGHYARPLRLYLALNAILMLILFLQGGAGFLLDAMPAEQLNERVLQSGKSVDAFRADADGWMTLVMVPLLSVFYAVASAPLFRLWDKENLGWRRGFRAAFAWLSAWTVPVIALSWWAYDPGPTQIIFSIAIVLLGAVAFVRMGRGRWFESLPIGIGKAVILTVAVQISAAIGGALVVAIGLWGASVTS